MLLNIQIKIQSLEELEFSFWNSKFNQLHPSPQENFVKYFASVNDKFPVGAEREREYVRIMKETLSVEPNFSDMEKEYGHLKDQYQISFTDLMGKASDVRTSAEKLNAIIVN